MRSRQAPPSSSSARSAFSASRPALDLLDPLSVLSLSLSPQQYLTSRIDTHATDRRRALPSVPLSRSDSGRVHPRSRSHTGVARDILAAPSGTRSLSPGGASQIPWVDSSGTALVLRVVLEFELELELEVGARSASIASNASNASRSTLELQALSRAHRPAPVHLLHGRATVQGGVCSRVPWSAAATMASDDLT